MTEVSDHALVRWLEREHGIDMELYRQKLAEHVAEIARAKPAYAEIDGLWYVFDGDRLVTVRPSRPKSNYARHDKKNRNGSIPENRDRQTWQSRTRKRAHK